MPAKAFQFFLCSSTPAKSPSLLASRNCRALVSNDGGVLLEDTAFATAALGNAVQTGMSGLLKTVVFASREMMNVRSFLCAAKVQAYRSRPLLPCPRFYATQRPGSCWYPALHAEHRDK